VGRLASVLALPLVLGATLLSPALASAATFTVNSTADQEAAGATNDGICDSDPLPGTPVCTLRAAIQEANGTAGPADLINLPNLGPAYALDEAGADEELGVDGDLDVRSSISLQGSGQPVVNATVADRVLNIGPEATNPVVSIGGVEIRGGSSVARGAGILVEGGTMTMSSTTVTANGAVSGAGLAQGGGVWINAGTGHAISVSTIDGNQAAGLTGAEGGGLWVGAGAAVSLTNSTISDNGASAVGGSAEGGGIWNAGTASLTHVTMSEDSLQGSPAEGGLVYAQAGTVLLRSTILNRGIAQSGAENCAGGTGSFTSFGSNLEANVTLVVRQCGTFGAGDLFVGDALIADLADRGGPTRTHALLNGSLALDMIQSCSPLAIDQRGEPRPGAFACDIGSFERQVLPGPGTDCLGLPPTIFGFAEDEKIIGTPANDVIVTQGGDDKVKGGDGNDRICGGKGNDTLRGGPGRDRISGEAGKDRLYGQAGPDNLRGGAGKDVLDGGKDVDVLDGGKLKDNCRGGPADKLRAC